MGNVELSDLVSYVEKIVPYFPEDEAAMNAQVSQVKNKLVAYGEPEQASYAEKGTSENNVLDSILDELESNLEEGTKEEREDLKDELYYVEQISSVNSNTKQVKRIDEMIEKIETGMNEGEESSNQDDIMDVNKILNVLSDRGIPQSKIEKVGFILNKKDGV